MSLSQSISQEEMKGHEDFKEMYDKQEEFIRNLAQSKLFSGGVGSGKTVTLCQNGFFLNVIMPGNRGALIRKHGSSLKPSTLKTLLHGNPEMDPVIPSDWIVEHNKNEHRIVHKTLDPNQHSEIYYFGVDKRKGSEYPEKLGSTEFGWIGVDEAKELDKEDWNFLETRLRHPVPVRQIFGATNPDSPEHWLYKMFYEPEDGQNVHVQEATYKDNPFIDERYRSRLEARYSGGFMKDRLLEGKWVASEGAVYPMFSRNTHVVSRDKASKKKSDFWAVGADSGYRNPRAFLVAKVTGKGDVWIVDEYYRTQTGIEDAEEWMKQQGYKDKVYRAWHDPSEPEEIEKLQNSGIPARKANNSIKPGIIEVVNYLDESEDGNENVIRISEKCQELQNEFLSYRYPSDDDAKERDETPIKENDHLMDALRYLIMGLRQGVNTSAKLKFA